MEKTKSRSSGYCVIEPDEDGSDSPLADTFSVVRSRALDRALDLAEVRWSLGQVEGFSDRALAGEYGESIAESVKEWNRYPVGASRAKRWAWLKRRGWRIGEAAVVMLVADTGGAR